MDNKIQKALFVIPTSDEDSTERLNSLLEERYTVDSITSQRVATTSSFARYGGFLVILNPPKWKE